MKTLVRVLRVYPFRHSLTGRLLLLLALLLLETTDIPVDNRVTVAGNAQKRFLLDSSTE